VNVPDQQHEVASMNVHREVVPAQSCDKVRIEKIERQFLETAKRSSFFVKRGHDLLSEVVVRKQSCKTKRLLCGLCSRLLRAS